MSGQFTRALHSRVALRLASLFVVCALVPLAAVAFITLFTTTRELEGQAREQLRHDAKTMAMDVFARLELQRQALALAGTALSPVAPDATSLFSQLTPIAGQLPDVLSLVSASGGVAHFGRAAVVDLDAEQRRFLESTGAVLVQAPAGGGDLLHVRVGAGASARVLVLSIDYERLFGEAGWEVLPRGSEACIRRLETLVCSPGASTDIARQIAEGGSDGDLTIFQDGEAWFLNSWSLPLRASYGADPITVAMMRPRAIVRAPLASFFRWFWSVLGLTLLAITWLTLVRVRRQMRPLVTLIEATRRLGRRDFTQPIEIASADEFEELGAAFTRLSRDLQQQFDDLEAFNLGALEALARAIDAKSPWTAGHSERVTSVAVDLAAEMGLGDELVGQLRRGGLVHDIGKLATPVEILDKAGPLTPDEERILQQHPSQGVHILEPVPAFRPLLPIVEQHHERWDGQGYPRRLAGEDIALTARVLAVADAFDAMCSDRPYRIGLPVSEAVRRIHAGAGTQFDPAVVAAFVRVFRQRAA